MNTISASWLIWSVEISQAMQIPLFFADIETFGCKIWACEENFLTNIYFYLIENNIPEHKT